MIKVSSRINQSTVGARLVLAERSVDAGVHAAGLLSAQALRARIRANINGADPHPTPREGDLGASFKVRRIPSRLGGTSLWTVYTNDPGAHRVEFGFGPRASSFLQDGDDRGGDTSGVDSLGRVYDQRPFPFIGPAIDAAGPDIESTFTSLVQAAIVSSAL